MKQWFYIEASRQCGPLGEGELAGLFQAGRLPRATLVWTDGMGDWAPASQLAVFALAAPSPVDSPYAPPVSDAGPAAAAWSDYEPSGDQIRPWVRYFARTLDFLLWCFIAGFAIALAIPELLEISAYVLAALLFASGIFAEAVMFVLFGTTPFKALLRVRVRNRDGSRLSFGRALWRAGDVTLRGQGLGIPIVSLITHIMAFQHLSNRGQTVWDGSGDFAVSHRTIAWWRWLVLVAGIAGFCALVALGAEGG